VADLPPAVVIGGENIAVSAARSLSRAGVAVYALGAPLDPVRHSRHCVEFTDVGAGEGVTERCMDWLRRRRLAGAAVLPCNDDSLELVATRRAELEELGYRPVEANDEGLLAMLDKRRTYELAGSLGVPAPRTATLTGQGDVEAVASGFSFPCALKPLHSHLFVRHFGLLKKVLVANDREQLASAAESMRELGLDVLVTEIVPGADDQFRSYYTYLDERGEPLFDFTKQKLRQWPIRFGLTTYHATIWDPEVAELGLRFAQGAGLRGVVNIEFKRDPRDGLWKIIECNHRFTAANDLVRASGIDVPLLAYCRATGRPAPVFGSYRLGLHMWHPVEDFRAMLAYRREDELTARAWFRSLLRPQHFPLLSLDDPKPTLVKSFRQARWAVRGLWRRAGAGQRA
jgi:D-aspartate ligase